MPDRFANFATSTTATTALTTTSTTMTVATNDGAKFPSKFPFMLLLGAPTSTYELVQCTARTGDTLTIVRGNNIPAPDTTTPQAWGVGSSVAQVATAGNWTNLWAQVPQQGFFNVLAYGAIGDGVTDDTTACQAAITACQNAGGGIVLFPSPLTFLISSPLVVSTDNVILMGEGWGSQIKAKTGFGTNPMVHVSTPTGFRYGFGCIELFLNGNNVAGVSGLQLDSVYHCLLDHLRVRYCPANSVFFNGASGQFGAYNYMRDCTITDGGAGVGVNTFDSEWVLIEHCSFVTFASAGGIGVELTNLNCSVVECQFDNIDTAIYASFASRNLIIGNQFDRAGTRFINLRGTQGCIVSNNSFNTKTGAGNECIYVNDPNNQYNLVTNNAVEPSSGWTTFINESANTGGPGNLYESNATAGLKIVVAANSGSIARDNIGHNPPNQLPAPAAPTLATATTGGTIAAGTYQVETTLVNIYGETVGSASASIVTTGTTSTITITAPGHLGNAYGWYAYVTQAGLGVYTRQQVAGSPSGFNRNLVLTAPPTSSGVNPPGSNTTSGFTQPAVPATTVAYRNAFGFDATVYISGGTVTAIAVGSQTITGFTSGMFRVPANQSITLTYSAAPSWTWVAE